MADLPFDPTTMDVVCARAPAAEWQGGGTPLFNIDQVLTHHAQTGMDFGFGGSGAADLALNVLALFLPLAAGDEGVKLYRGQRCSRAAWDLHHVFKWKFIAPMPRQGGTIPGDVIRAWIAENQGAGPRGAA